MPHKQIQGQRVENNVKTLKRKRAGKKGLITKKIMQIKQLIEKRGSTVKPVLTTTFLK